MTGRRADFAGAWYPGDRADCTRVIDAFAAAGAPCPEGSERAVGGIVPHAGWVFSGEIACKVIKCLPGEAQPRTCLIFGRHLHPGSDNFIMKEGRWNTPLGDLEIDSGVAGEVAGEAPFRVETPSSYEPDNTIELQLPFIRYFFPDIKIVPMGLPPRKASLDIAKRAAQISKEMGRKTLVLGSTDLTHYGYNYGFTPQGVGEGALAWVREVNDKQAVDKMLAMDEEGLIEEALQNHNACCAGAAGAAIAAAKMLGAVKAEKVAYATSYDVRPDSSFVGYVGVLFTGR